MTDERAALAQALWLAEQIDEDYEQSPDTWWSFLAQEIRDMWLDRAGAALAHLRGRGWRPTGECAESEHYDRLFGKQDQPNYHDLSHWYERERQRAETAEARAEGLEQAVLTFSNGGCYCSNPRYPSTPVDKYDERCVATRATLGPAKETT